MTVISDKYNELPFEVREITSAVIGQMRVNQLKIEKDRLTKRHAQSIKEINEHIENIERDLNN